MDKDKNKATLWSHLNMEKKKLTLFPLHSHIWTWNKKKKKKKMNTVQTSEMTKHLPILAQMTAASLEWASASL